MKKLLMVDDDATIRRIAEISLSRIGKWEVVTADSGFKALTALTEFTPDLIMLDVMMPGMDGPSTFRKIREIDAFKDIPIIFMTAKVQKHEVQTYFDSGISGVIIKPFDPVTLPAEVERIFRLSAASLSVA